METVRLLVTEITDFGTQHCVAGWDLDRKKMLRPEPAPGCFWDAPKIGQKGWFERNAIVEFSSALPNPPTAYPHRTEDRVIDGIARRHGELPTEERKATLRATVSGSLDELFDGNLQVQNAKGFVDDGTNCRSLGALELAADQVLVYEDSYDPSKLRCRIPYGSGYLIPTVTSTGIRQLHRDKGIVEIQKALRKAKKLHLRVGLARAFAQAQNRCYMQVNHVAIEE